MKVKAISCLDENLGGCVREWLRTQPDDIEISATETVYKGGGHIVHLIYYRRPLPHWVK